MTTIEPTIPKPLDNTAVADPIHIGQGGDMRFGDAPGTDPFLEASLKDASRAGAPAKAQDPAAATGGDKGSQAVELAKSQLGVNYVYGARQWGKALDCSGLTQQVYAKMGIQIGGDTYTQVQQGQEVPGGLANAKPGDLVFTTGDIGMRANGHVAIYIGGGKVIAAPHTGAQVQVQDWSGRAVSHVRRYF